MTTTREFLTKFNQAWADNDVETIVNSVTDDIHFKMVTDAEGIRGKEAFSSWLKDMSNNDFQVTLTTDRVIIDGNGRIGRFIMNLMLASGGYPWTVVPVEHRTDYMQALEAASVGGDIVPFTRFLASLVDAR